VIDAVQILPPGGLAIGMQLPVAAQSTMFAAPWEALHDLPPCRI
jgi:hypothetical protein